MQGYRSLIGEFSFSRLCTGFVKHDRVVLSKVAKCSEGMVYADTNLVDLDNFGIRSEIKIPWRGISSRNWAIYQEIWAEELDREKNDHENDFTKRAFEAGRKSATSVFFTRTSSLIRRRRKNSQRWQENEDRVRQRDRTGEGWIKKVAERFGKVVHFQTVNGIWTAFNN